MMRMKKATNNTSKNYIMTTLMTNTELDADVLSVVCVLDGPVRMEDVVPHMMSRNDWFAAKSHALDKGWIVKDAAGPSNRGARYVSNDPTPQHIDEANTTEELKETAIDYVVSKHAQMVESLFRSNPGTSFNAWDLRRGRGGPCTKFTWPRVKRVLSPDLGIATQGDRRARTYTHIPYTWLLEERVMELESMLSAVVSALSGRPSKGVVA